MLFSGYRLLARVPYFYSSMQFQQSQLTRSTQFALREHGFYISQRSGRGQVDMAVEIPYEELLPLRLEYKSAVPGKSLRWLAAGALWIVGNAVHVQYSGNRPLPQDFWVFTLSAFAGMGLLLVYAWHNWWHQAILHTARLHVVLADHPRDRQQFRAFTERLDAHTKNYLRQEYGAINPLGFIEPQVRRVAWLREMDVLSAAEAKALTTRLTGRLTERGLRSMGQRLEPLYVN
jgi:hypothetical protein